MHLATLLERRAVPAAGLFASLTTRCPLSCAHCSTGSGPAGADLDEAAAIRFVSSFTPADRPDFLLLTGGEPLLRPALVAGLAGLAARAGTGTYLITGGFFLAEDVAVPGPIARALAAVQHVAFSLDAFHQRQVPAARIFAAVHGLLDAGRDVSFQLTGRSADDPYLVRTTAAVRAEFADRVPMLVGRLGAVGRAAGWWRPVRGTGDGDATVAPVPAVGCALAAWPAVGPTGRVTACCHQRVVDHDPLPDHLDLGDVAIDDWAIVRDRCTGSPTLRGLRVLGPAGLLEPAQPPGPDYCGTCWRLTPVAGPARRRRTELAAAVEGDLVRQQVRDGAEGFARRYAIGSYAPYTRLGLDSSTGMAG